MDTRSHIHTNATALAVGGPCVKMPTSGVDSRPAVTCLAARALAERDAG